MIRAKGSLTVYLSLVLVLMLSLLFTLLESARVRGLQADADRMTQAAAESVFAEYCRVLLEDYDLFFLDGGYGTGSFSTENVQARMMTYLETNADPGSGSQVDFYGISPQETVIDAYQLATDAGGAAFYEMACNYAETALPATALNDLMSYLTGDGEESDDADDLTETLDDALDALEDDTNYSETENTELTEEEIAAAENVSEETKGILEAVSEMKSKGILSLLVEDAADLSSQAITASETVSARDQETGTEVFLEGDGSRLLFQWYLGEKLLSFTDEAEDHALCYELEYCYAGKDTDLENLESAAEAILLIREGVNLAYLMTDSEKKAEAQVVALAIAGVFAVPALLNVIEAAVLAAWAFLESVKDVQMLLTGETLPLVKTSSNWQTTLSVRSVTDGSSAGSSSGSSAGLSYENYLQVLLLTCKEEKLITRSLDLIEQNVRLSDGNAQFQIDHCIAGASWSVTWSGSPMFLSLTSLNGRTASGGYSFTADGQFAYE